MAFLLQVIILLVNLLKGLQLQERRLAVTNHVLVHLHALASGAQLLKVVSQRLRIPLLFGNLSSQRLYLFSYLIILFCQESDFGIQGLVGTRQVVGRADIVEGIE